MRCANLLVVPLLFLVHSLACALNGAEPTEAQTKQIAQLIENLASKATAPGKGSKELAPTEEAIWKATDELTKLGILAFPQLIAHLDDPRFSFSEDSLASAAVYHRSVGYLCQQIFGRQLKVYVPWNVPDPRGTPGFGTSELPSEKQQAQAWWEANRSKTLWELQVANIEQVIALNEQRKAAGFDSPEQRQLCDAAIQANRELAKQLTATKTAQTTKPYRPVLNR
ncbi:hypothetical protein NA78x_000142 [Anatilimnocola sp. NA78]|uniref:hypothetical protein n=1 Tax=Anatilimnocola sp. NA78 TaxID=3415683 RepID=UPI003CE4D2A9